MALRLIDLICDRHQELILNARIWPVGYRLGNDTTCSDCASRIPVKPSTFRPFPDFGQVENAAIHESGHVLVALAHGFAVNYLSLEGSGRDGSTAHWSGRTTEKAGLDSVEFAEVTVAGEAAVRHWLMREGRADDASLIDAAFGGLLDAEDLEQMTWSGTPDSAVAGADRAVAEHWPAVERVADALLSRGRLSGDEVAELARLNCGVS